MVPFILAYGLLTLILIQDVRSRAIWWFLPPLLFADLLWLCWERTVLLSVVFNLAFVALIISFLYLYISVRFGNPRDLFRRYFGLGDALFLLALAPLCAFRSFIILFTIGTFAVLVVHGIVLLFRKQPTIPYAGYFAFIILVYLIALQAGTDLLSFLPV